MRTKSGIYFVSRKEFNHISELPSHSREKKKWDKREIRIIEDNLYRTPRGKTMSGSEGPNRKQRRNKKAEWKNDEQKSFTENKTKKVLKKEQRKQKRKQNRKRNR